MSHPKVPSSACHGEPHMAAIMAILALLECNSKTRVKTSQKSHRLNSSSIVLELMLVLVPKQL